MTDPERQPLNSSGHQYGSAIPTPQSIPRSSSMRSNSLISHSYAERKSILGTSPAPEVRLFKGSKRDEMLTPKYFFGDTPRRGSVAFMKNPIADPEGESEVIAGLRREGVDVAETTEQEPLLAEAGRTLTSGTSEPKVQTPLPKGQMFVLVMVMLSESVQVQILFPFIYFMVESFHVTDDPKKIGQYVGLLGASFCAAQFLTSTLWGSLSDKFGRKPILLIGMIGSAITAVMLGFSKTLWWAIMSRALCGLMNGNIGIAKSVLAEITDETNRTGAFQLFGLMWEVGSVLGPMIGGLLADPAKQYPGLFGNFQPFIEFPFLLPCIAGAMFSLIGWFFGFFFLKETKGLKVQEKTETDEEVEEEPPFMFGLPKLCIYSIAAYGILCLANIMFEEVLPLFVASPRSVGGLGFTVGQMGMMMSILGAIALVVQLYFVEEWERKYGLLQLNIFWLVVALISTLLTPFLTLVKEPSWLMWTAVLFVLTVNLLGWGIAFTAEMVLINDTAPPDKLGISNGLSQSLAAFTRTVGPALGGWLFTVGLNTNLPWPLDKSLVYNVMCIITLVGIWYGFVLKRAMSGKYGEATGV